MSDLLLKKLDEIDAQYNDWKKSSEAELKAAKEGVEAVQKELDAQRQQLADIAAVSQRHVDMNRGEKEINRYVGEVVRDAFRGQVMKQQSEGTDADGGYLVPEDWLTEIRSTQNIYGAVRRIWGNQIIPLTTDVTYVPVRAYGDTAGNQPEMASISENAAITADTGKVGQVTLTAAKYGTLVYVSRELIADAFVDFVGAYLRVQIAHEAAKKEDDLVFADATNGLLNHANIQETVLGSGDVDFSDVTIEEVREQQDSVTDEAFENGAYYAHRSVRTMIANKRGGGSAAGDGPFLWGNPNVGIPPTFDGYPFEHVGKMPANSASAVSTEFILFGDLPAAMLVGQRTAGELMTSSDFRFANDQIAVRYLFRFAFGTDANLGRAAHRIKTAAS